MARSRLSCRAAGSSWPTTETHCWKRSMNPAAPIRKRSPYDRSQHHECGYPQSGHKDSQTPFHVLPFEMAMIPRISVINRIGDGSPDPEPTIRGHCTMQANARGSTCSDGRACGFARRSSALRRTCVVAWIRLHGSAAGTSDSGLNLGKASPGDIAPRTCTYNLFCPRSSDQIGDARSRF